MPHAATDFRQPTCAEDPPFAETQRLDALARYRLLDTLPEQGFDDLTALAKHICDTPIALISIADARRQWFKSKIGVAISEVSRETSFSAHTIRQSGLFIVPDASADARFSDSPLVAGEWQVRFYAGAPLVTPDGYALGALCVMDRVPRQLTASQQNALRMLGQQVMAQLELRRHARGLAESEERLRTVTDNARAGLIMVDADRRYVYANVAYAEILNLPSSAIVGRRVADVLPGVYDEQIRPHLDQAFAGRRVACELRRPAPDGERVYALTYEPTAADGPVAKVVVVIADITERRRAEGALREREEQLHLYAEHSPVGVAMFDRDMRYLVVSRRWVEDHRLGDQRLVGRSHYEVFPEISQRRKEIHQRCLAGAIEKCDEEPLARADGRVQWIRWEIRPWHRADGDIGGIIIFSEDITERRSLEAQYQQAQKMEAVGRLAGGVAHDFNNLLTAILGYCELLLGDLGPAHPFRKDICGIQKAGTRAAGLTRQLLAFSRKQIIEPTLLDLNLLITDMEGMLARLIGEDVQVTLNLQPGLAAVMADRGQVEQVVMNLAVNARDAMPSGGRLTIATEDVELDEHYAKAHASVTPGPFVALTVADTGTGITPEVQARLFEPFFTTKEIGKGTGLGLATVHGIAARAGGSVNVYSEIGKGTSFTVYLPKADAPKAIAAPPPAPRLQGGVETVLVVEDAEAIRELIATLLRRRGYTALIAANADEALTLFNAHPSVDVLLTDVVMPGASGPQLTTQLVKQRPGLKVIYMSGYTEDAIVHHGVLNPGIAFMHKPFTADTLGRKIREVLDAQAG